jgi:hypothetical protein
VLVILYCVPSGGQESTIKNFDDRNVFFGERQSLVVRRWAEDLWCERFADDQRRTTNDRLLRPALQGLSQCALHLFQVFSREFVSILREIENVNRHLAFSVDEGNFDVALVMGKTGGYRV